MRGVTDDTYTRVMAGLRPDTTGLSAIHNQAEFKQQLWQYLNRATSDWKITAGNAAAQQYAPLLACIEKDFSVEPAFTLGVWGIESAFGDPIVEKKSHAAGHSLARGAGLGRAAPSHLLGRRAHPRADHRAARHGYPRADDRFLGRRHGSHAMDAGGVAQRWYRL